MNFIDDNTCHNMAMLGIGWRNAQWLSNLVGLREDLSSVPKTHVR